MTIERICIGCFIVAGIITLGGMFGLYPGEWSLDAFLFGVMLTTIIIGVLLSGFDETAVTLDAEKIEQLAASAHDAWLEEKRNRGVTTWPNENGIEQMVPYADLHEEIREFDRIVVRAIIEEIFE